MVNIKSEETSGSGKGADKMGNPALPKLLRYIAVILASVFFILTIHYPVPRSRDQIPKDFRDFGLRAGTKEPIETPSIAGTAQKDTTESKLDRFLEDIKQEKAMAYQIAFGNGARQKPGPGCERSYTRVADKLAAMLESGSISPSGADIIADRVKSAFAVNDKQTLTKILTSLQHPDYERQAAAETLYYDPCVVIDSHKGGRVNGIVVSADLKTAMLFTCSDDNLPPPVVGQVRRKDLAGSRFFKVFYFSLLLAAYIVFRLSDYMVLRADKNRPIRLDKADTLREHRKFLKTKLQALHMRRQSDAAKALDGDMPMAHIHGKHVRDFEWSHVLIGLFVVFFIIAEISLNRYLTPPDMEFNEGMRRFIVDELDFKKLKRVYTVFTAAPQKEIEQDAR